MAQAPSHKFGQCIGDFIEVIIEPHLSEVCRHYGLYLDRKGRRGTRPGKKVSWRDLYGNSHDLDFVIEKGGDDNAIGQPIAFIETAWRRHTKHSKNKAQEISGALEPLYDNYHLNAPFLGAVLVGDWTQPAINQLSSRRFTVLYFPFEDTCRAFKEAGFDIYYEEDTADEVVREKIKRWELLSISGKKAIAENLKKVFQPKLDLFTQTLRAVIERSVARIIIIPLHGQNHEIGNISEAVSFVEKYENLEPLPFLKLEIELTFNNGNFIRGVFRDKASAIDFLQRNQ